MSDDARGRCRRVGVLVLAGWCFALPALAAGGGPAADEPIRPVPEARGLDANRVALGRRLFADPRLSANGRVSCSSCHDPAFGGSDQRRTASGAIGRPAQLNTPTIYNAALNFRQFWDGRAESLEAQVDLVMQRDGEFGSRWPDVVARLRADPLYVEAFHRAYPDGLVAANVREAIVTYERSLVTPGSRFDRWLRGDTAAITAHEREGYAAFKRSGCIACHQGVNVGGNMYQKFGVMADYLQRHGPPKPPDLGRYRVTGVEADRYVFKVPGLRNVELTAPYLHDGSAATLEEAVDVMFRYQLGRPAHPRDRDAIVAFLRTLTGPGAGRP